MYRLTALCEDARTVIARLSAVAVGLGAWLRALAIAGRSQVVWGVLPGSVVLTVMVLPATQATVPWMPGFFGGGAVDGPDGVPGGAGVIEPAGGSFGCGHRRRLG